jgi:formylglycine-generating enzyme required for sulfatase activity
LPTEAEWEYACRGGAPAYQVFHFGNSLSSTQANFHGGYPYGGAAKGVHLGCICKVGSYPANGFSLHDMHGNILEWCQDWYDENYYAASVRQDPQGPEQGSARVTRGGIHSTIAGRCRSACRDSFWPDEWSSDIGFRLAAVLSLEE